MDLHLTATEWHLPHEITVSPATRHKWTHAALTTARQAGTRFTYMYPGGMKGWVDLGDWLYTYRNGLPARRRSPIQVLTRQSDALTTVHH